MAELTALTNKSASTGNISKDIFFSCIPEYESPFIMRDGNFEKNENVLIRNRSGIKLKGVDP